MLCLNCRYVSPRGCAFCQHCGLSLGAKLCPKRHSSPMGAKFCGQCGSSKLSKAARCVRLGGISGCLASIIIGGAVLIAVVHAALLLHLAASLAVRAACLVICKIIRPVDGIIFAGLLAFMGSYLLPESCGKPIRRGMQSTARHFWSFVKFFVRKMIVCCTRLVQPDNGRKG